MYMECPDVVQMDSPVFGGHQVVLQWVREWLNKAMEANTTASQRCPRPDLFRNQSWDNPELTYQGCRAFVGDRRWYNDIGSRVYAWVIPVLFLLFNISLGPADKFKLLAIVHAVGDPIDTIWSLLDKLQAWHRCYEEAAAFVEEKSVVQDARPHEQGDMEISTQILATVFAGIEDVVGHVPGCERVYREVAEELQACDGTALQPGGDVSNFVNPDWRRVALHLAESRTNQLVRTFLALVVYLFAIIAEFVDQISGNGDMTPAGRIGAAMALSFLIPITLLSNLLGTFPSRRTCLDICAGLMPEIAMRLCPDLDNGQYVMHRYFDAMSFMGSTYSFRPGKLQRIRSASGLDRRTRLLLPWLAMLPLAFGFIPAMILHHYAAPPGFGCRHLWILGLFATWIISMLLTNLLQELAYRNLNWNRTETVFWQRRNFYFWLIYIKDLVIGVSAIVLVFLSVAGIFSNCWCWCRVLFVGERDAWLPLWYTEISQDNKRSKFPWIVAAFQACQFLYVFFIARWRRRGRRLAQWGETLKRRVWWQVHSGI